MDVLTPEQRRRCMSAIRNKDTKPELLVRLLLRRMGYRYRLHSAGLPGKPDVVLRKQRLVIFVHGCFWHSHRCRYGKVIPVTNAKFWQSKRAENVRRDKRNRGRLRRAGWSVITVWECWTRNPDNLFERLVTLLQK